MVQLAASYQAQTSSHGIFSNGALNQDYTKPSNQKTSSNEGWQKAVVIGTVLSTAFVGLSISATESISAFNQQYDSSVHSIQSDTNLQRVVLFNGINDNLPWLSEFYKSAFEVSKAKQIYPLVSGIRELFINQEYAIVDDILLEMDHSKLSHTAMVAFITSTFPAREKLENWHLSVDRVKLSLEKDGLDSNDILQGLI
jgi:hypothetical protein